MPEPEPTPTPPEPSTPPTEPATDWKAKYDELQTQARKWEDRAKANNTAAKELEQLRQQSMTEQEKAVEQARTEARMAALAEVGGRLVDAAVRVASAGRLDDAAVGVLLDGLDRSKFLGSDGEVDEKAVASFVNGIAPSKQEPTPPGFPDLGQGARGQKVSGGPADDFAQFLTGQLKR